MEGKKGRKDPGVKAKENTKTKTNIVLYVITYNDNESCWFMYFTVFTSIIYKGIEQVVGTLLQKSRQSRYAGIEGLLSCLQKKRS